MTNIDKGQAILDLLKKHPPITRKEIHDNLPPGTYDGAYTLKDCLDNISQRLLALEKKGLATRAGTNDDGIILWTVPAAATEPQPAEPETTPPTLETPPPNLTAEIMRNNPPPVGFPNAEWPSDSEPASPDQPAKTVGDLALAELDAALATIRTTVALALSLRPSARIENKAETLEMMGELSRAMDEIAPRYGLLLDRLYRVVSELEEA